MNHDHKKQIELVDACNQFAIKQSKNGYTIVVECFPNDSIWFRVEMNGRMVPAFKDVGPVPTMARVRFSNDKAVLEVNKTLTAIKEYMQTSLENDQQQTALHTMQNNGKGYELYSQQRRRLLQRHVPEKLRLSEWYKKSFLDEEGKDA